MRRAETFSFLGFTHYCSTNQSGHFFVMRKTQSARMIRKLKELRIEARRRMHWPLREQQHWLTAVLRGHFSYYGLLGNSRALSNFAYEVRKLWFRALCRRSQKSAMTWERFNQFLKIFPLPAQESFTPEAITSADLGLPLGGAHCGKAARWDLRG